MMGTGLQQQSHDSTLLCTTGVLSGPRVTQCAQCQRSFCPEILPLALHGDATGIATGLQTLAKKTVIIVPGTMLIGIRHMT